MKARGAVVAWGYNLDGQAEVPTGLSGVTAIAADDAHSLALVGSPGVSCSITGTSKSDDLYGTSGEDTICGRSGNASINGGAAKRHPLWDPGNDTLIGGSGRDHLYGDGYDVLRGGDESPGDYLNGGKGYDKCVIDGWDGARSVGVSLSSARLRRGVYASIRGQARWPRRSRGTT